MSFEYMKTSFSNCLPCLLAKMVSLVTNHTNQSQCSLLKIIFTSENYTTVSKDADTSRHPRLALRASLRSPKIRIKEILPVLKASSKKI